MTSDCLPKSHCQSGHHLACFGFHSLPVLGYRYLLRVSFFPQLKSLHFSAFSCCALSAAAAETRSSTRLWHHTL